ncbi:hypothetical protein T484DRAFT_1754494 [Baffinella frigidus]|nr:hypothetical protein T484DRAFT_1754494 [Cryptophyta sp. CCMP2293]
MQEREPHRDTDAIFDFRVTHNGHSHSVAPNTLVLRDMSHSHSNPDHNHLARASRRFAQQLDPNAIKEQTRWMDNGFNATAEITSLFLLSTKLVQERDYNSIIKKYVSFTHTSNLMARNVVASFKRSIISSLKLVDTTNICAAMQYDPPQKELVRYERRLENVYGDYSEWGKILQSLSFDEAKTKEYLLSTDSDFGNDLPTIKFVLVTLEQIGAEDLSMTDSLRVYLLTNIKNLSSLVAIKAFLTEAMPATFNASDAANVFTACMADARFTQDQFTNDLAWFMCNVEVCTTFQDKCLFFMDAKESNLKWSQNEVKKNHIGRARLRYRVGIHSSGVAVGGGVSGGGGAAGVADNGGGGGGGGGGGNKESTHTQAPASQLSQTQEDSLQGWALRARVPPAISHKSKLLGYVLMSQMNFADPSKAIRAHFANNGGGDIASNMLAQRVCKPHSAAIIEFLHMLTVHVTPFEELLAFRADCFADFSHTDSKDLSWLKFLQLYVAVYQNDDVWPHVWKHFCAVLSHQVLIAISNFKLKHVYAVDTVADICMQNEESQLKAVHEVN